MVSIGIALRSKRGFTLIELLIVVAIIGILATIAVPQFADYTSRTRATAAIAELESLKKAVSVCINDTEAISGCSAGTNGIPPIAAFIPTKNVTNISSLVNGVIVATSGATSSGGAALTVIMTPTLASGAANMVWTNSGTICHVTRGLKVGAGGC